MAVWRRSNRLPVFHDHAHRGRGTESAEFPIIVPPLFFAGPFRRDSIPHSAARSRRRAQKFSTLAVSFAQTSYPLQSVSTGERLLEGHRMTRPSRAGACSHSQRRADRSRARRLGPHAALVAHALAPTVTAISSSPLVAPRAFRIGVALNEAPRLRTHHHLRRRRRVITDRRRERGY